MLYCFLRVLGFGAHCFCGSFVVFLFLLVLDDFFLKRESKEKYAVFFVLFLGVFFTIWNKSALFLFCYFFLLGLGILFFLNSGMGEMEFLNKRSSNQHRSTGR